MNGGSSHLILIPLLLGEPLTETTHCYGQAHRLFFFGSTSLCSFANHPICLRGYYCIPSSPDRSLSGCDGCAGHRDHPLSGPCPRGGRKTGNHSARDRSQRSPPRGEDVLAYPVWAFIHHHHFRRPGYGLLRAPTSRRAVARGRPPARGATSTGPALYRHWRDLPLPC